MQAKIEKFSQWITDKHALAWATFRVLAGLAVLAHGVYLLGEPWAVGNWLEVRTSEALRLGVSVATIAGGIGIAAGVATRFAALVAASLYYWAAITNVISVTIEPVQYTVFNAPTFLALLLIGIVGAGKYSATERWSLWKSERAQRVKVQTS
jgi:uncharacterized membrane protein YphA (DoxX/SURF4 family)